jgi:hypothetical protein
MDLFMELRRRQVQDDWGLILKVAFVVAILLSRIQRRNTYYTQTAGNSSNGVMSSWNIQSIATVFAVIMGLLAHMGYLSLLYRFFYHHQYFQRILWDGEEITVEMALQEESTGRARHRRGQQPEEQDEAREDDRPARVENDPGGGWRHTILGGGIAPADGDDEGEAANENRSFLLQTLQDIFLFFASFFLSIFPMWHPAAIPRAVAENRVQEPPPPPLAEPQNGNNQNDRQPLLPRVPSPVDPTEPLEESDTDEREGDTI